MKKIVLGLFIMVGVVQAKQWYVLNGKTMKCEKHDYSPYDYKSQLGGELVNRDGIFVYTAKNGTPMLFGTSMEKCKIGKKAITQK